MKRKAALFIKNEKQKVEAYESGFILRHTESEVPTGHLSKYNSTKLKI